MRAKLKLVDNNFKPFDSKVFNEVRDLQAENLKLKETIRQNNNTINGLIEDNNYYYNVIFLLSLVYIIVFSITLYLI